MLSMMRLASLLIVLAGCSSSPVTDERVVAHLRGLSADARATLIARAEGSSETRGAIHRGTEPLTLRGTPLAVGAPAPAVTLIDPALGALELGALRGSLVVLSVVPSIDTRVCEAQTHRVSDAMPELPPGTTVVTVSRDLPFAQGRFAEEARTQTKMGSDYRGGAFGRAFGIEVVETGLLARSVWVIAKDGTIAYREIVDDQGTEPDYTALLVAVKQAAGT